MQDMPHGVSSKKSQADISKNKKRIQKKMAGEQATANEAIAKAVAEATRVAIHAMVAAAADIPQSMVGPKIGGPAMNQPSFNWEAGNKYSEFKNFRLEVNNIITSSNTPHAEQLTIVK